MNDVADHRRTRRVATDGEIAVINLESARLGAWRRFLADPRRDRLAEAVVDLEMLAAQFVGDLDALDRMASLEVMLDASSAPASLVRAQIASAAHRFEDARRHLAQAQGHVEAREVERQLLAIDQACGARLDAVLDARRRIAASKRLEDLVPLGAVLADLDRFDEADVVYREALHAYDDVSPFPLAWACFQLGLLWGELVDHRDPVRAARWYRRAIDYLPQYVKARVHLAEICADGGQVAEAEALLAPVLSSGDPEVSWRLADVMMLRGSGDEAAAQLRGAHRRFEELLVRHPLAFADHAAEFYMGSGGDASKAFELARLNFSNRPTARAFELYADARDHCRRAECPTAGHS